MTAALDDHYLQLESRWEITDRIDDYSPLVTPHGNSDEPFHRWFHLKEAFSWQLLQQILKEERIANGHSFRLLDCFAGIGTSLVSAAGLSREFKDGVFARGVERNPFLYLAARTKLRAMVQGELLIPDLLSMWSKVESTWQKVPAPPIPDLATFADDRYFPDGHLNTLLRIPAAIDRVCDDGLVKDILRVAAASVVEPASKLRKDGRALRYERYRIAADPLLEFRRRLEVILSDLKTSTVTSFSGDISCGDARSLAAMPELDEIDLILFSPPYPNNIDYTEVYKMEAWYLGLYESRQAVTAQRQATIRSHPSIKFEDEYSYQTSTIAGDVDALVQPLLEHVPADRYTYGRQQVIKGWTDDMAQVLIGARSVIHENGRLVFVVANSSHGNDLSTPLIIAADLLMAALAELSGWKVSEVRIARRPKRRTRSPFLRESVVVLAPS